MMCVEWKNIMIIGVDFQNSYKSFRTASPSATPKAKAEL